MKRSSLLFTLIISLFLIIISSPARAQSEETPAGKIIEKVICRSDASQSYALYLPSAYSPAKKWPLIMAFDPAARGRVPVERFKEAAEKYGYIIIGSNNSRNGPRNEATAALRAMWNDATTRYSIDEKRIYAAGFSGGARVACGVGYALKGQVAGVIACGAGFPQEIAPSESTPFVFFGTIGTDDFNYPELKELDRKLGAAGMPHRIEEFDGGHDWASSELCVMAIEWMELQAMRAGRRARDEKFIAGLFKNEIDKARAHEAAGRIYQAYVSYDLISRDFKGLKDVAEFEAKAAQLKESKETLKAIKQEKEQEDEQKRRAKEPFTLRARIEGPKRATLSDATDDAAPPDSSTLSDAVENRMQAMSELKRAIADLRKKADAKESSPERSVARRALNQYLIWSYERAMSLVRAGKYSVAIAVLSIDAETMPDDWHVLYRLASAYSLSGDKKRAIDTLKKAVQKGFADSALLEGDNDFNTLRDEPAFKKIIEELGRKTG
ncbi:MAG TPA: hypothetical protein VNN73_08015 [Blastocatellia bacterium]|nr:hypothetical protein [Blastocatellia bacterium]